MASGFVIRPNEYYDSVFLMGVNKRLSEMDGISQTAVLMGSEKNKVLLADIGIHGVKIDAVQPNDLVVAVIADSEKILEAVLGDLDHYLSALDDGAGTSHLRTLEEALVERPSANLAVLSIPGEYVYQEARRALEADLNAFIFSSENFFLIDRGGYHN